MVAPGQRDADGGDAATARVKRHIHWVTVETNGVLHALDNQVLGDQLLEER